MLQNPIFANRIFRVAAALLWLTPYVSTPVAAEGTSQPAIEQYERAKATLDRMYAALSAVRDKVDVSVFDVEQLAKKLGSNPQRAFEFVRDHVGYEPYWGQLRGPRGTLVSRSGNALDRSLLLAALIKQSGLEIQIVAGRLDPDKATQMAARAFEARPRAPEVVPPGADLLRDVTSALGMSADQLANHVKKARAASDAANERLWEVVETQSAAISTALGRAGVKAGSITPQRVLQQEAAEHYWVRYRENQGKWVDLDPSFPNAQVGSTFASNERFFSPSEVPAELSHRLAVKLILQVGTRQGNSPETSNDITLIDRDFPLADGEQQGIRIANIPWPAIDPVTEDQTAQFSGIKEYIPILTVGDQVIHGPSFDLSGAMFKTLPGTTAGNAERIGGSLKKTTGALDKIFAKSASSRILSQRLEFKLVSPQGRGQQPSIREIRRDILPSQRSESSVPQVELAKKLFWSTELHAPTGSVNADFTSWLALRAMIDNRGLAVDLLRRSAGLPGVPVATTESSRLGIHAAFLVTAISEQTEFLTRGRFSNLRVYRATPGLIVLDTIGGPGEPISLRQRFDIAAAPLRVISKSDETSAVADLAVQVGVLQTRLEWLVLSGIASANSLGVSSSNVVANATEDLAMGLASGAQLITLKSASDLNLAPSSELPDAVKGEIAQALQRGVFVLMLDPRTMPRASSQQQSWWTVDQTAAEVIGVRPGGRGEAETLVLYGKIVATGASVITGFFTCVLGWRAANRKYVGNTPGGVLLSCLVVGAGFGLGAYGNLWNSGLAQVMGGLAIAIGGTVTAFQ